MLAYLALALAINLCRFRSIHPSGKELLTHAFDAATFAASSMVLYGIFEPPVLTLIGNTKPFLMIGSLAGILYSVGVLFPRPG